MRGRAARPPLGTLIWALFAACWGGESIAATAFDPYPVKPVRLIVPLAPGGGSDIVARIIALELTSIWDQPVVVDNRPGAGSTVGTGIAARSPADGYTVLVSSSSIAISPALYRGLPFDVKRDFTPVTLLASQPSILAIHSSVRAASIAELVALAKEQPGKLSYASAGSGSATHLGTELLKYTAGVELLHVPYKSAGLATSALLAGEVQLLLTNMASVLPHVKSGRIKALGISSTRRSPLAPEVPTINEAGIPGFEYSTWYGMLAPAGAPHRIVKRLYDDTARTIRLAHAKERFAARGLEVHGTSPLDFSNYLNAELIKWEKLIRSANVRIE